jgi:hypothetical protein
LYKGVGYGATPSAFKRTALPFVGSLGRGSNLVQKKLGQMGNDGCRGLRRNFYRKKIRIEKIEDEIEMKSGGDKIQPKK